MCDTMVAVGKSTKSGKVIFAKNSDRECNEPHLLVKVPKRTYNLKEKPMLKTTYIEIPQVAETYSVMLLKPSWLWGCEMGANEFGLNIGNEAVFTLEQQGPEALLGMDIIRIALERCKTAEEAVDMIAWLLEEYGQGGKCGYTNDFYYHNSFLIADPESAWVIETAGKYWAAKKIEDFYVISNGISLGNNFDRCHPKLIQNAIDKGWCRSEEDFHFGWCYGNKEIEARAKFIDRSCLARNILNQYNGEITEEIMMQALRLHSPETQDNPFETGSAGSICMHYGDNARSQTTGSYVAVLDKQKPSYYVTGSSLACISLFKPCWFMDDMPGFYSDEKQDKDAAIAYWFQRECIHRAILAGEIERKAYLAERDALETDFLSKVKSLDVPRTDNQQLRTISTDFFQREQVFVQKWYDSLKKPISYIPAAGTDAFKQAWESANRALFQLHEIIK